MRLVLCLPVLLLALIVRPTLAADAPARAESSTLPRLADELAKAVKAGAKPKAWVTVFGKRSELEICEADSKSISVLVQGNPLPLAWNKLANDEVLNIAKAIATTGERLALAAEVALELGFADQAGELLTKALAADPALDAKVREVAAKLPNRPAPAVQRPDHAPQAAERPPESASEIKTRLPMGWWKDYRAPAVPASKVHPSHPRLFLRESAWGNGGLTLEALRWRATQEPWKGFIPRFTTDLSSLALKYLLTGDTAAANDAVTKLQAKLALQDDTDDGNNLEDCCLAYDWLSAYPNFSAEQKKQAAENIAAVADVFIKRLDKEGPHIFHTRMHAWANGIVFAGLALAGEHPRAEEFLTYGYRYWREKLFPSRWHLDGAWANGFGYGRKFLCCSTFFFLNAWKSGTGEDLWALVEREQNDWARAMLMYLIYAHRPDGNYPRYGDCFNADDEKFSCGLAMLVSSGTRDPYAAGLADSLHRKHGLRCVEGRWNIFPLLFWDSALPKRTPDDLPLSRLFGPQALGCVVMRSGWGPKDTHVFFKCGDYIENHGHFDQGAFEICRDKPLAIDSGAYSGGMNSPHWTTYYHQSIANNTLLIVDPADSKDTGCQRVVDWQGADTLDKYLARTECEMGSILEFKTGADYAAVVCDMTAAYAAAKVKSVTRSLAFVKGTYLVVCDSVQPAKQNLSARFLLHYPIDATVDKTRCVIENGASRLTCDTLWPENAKISKLPGFQVNGQDRPPTGNFSKEDAGAGRIEVETTSSNPLLVHVLTVGPKDAPADRAQVKVDGSTVRVEVGGRSVTFTDRSVVVR